MHAHPPADAAGGLTAAQLAHELNSLLDGALRCVDLVHGWLDGPDEDPAERRTARARLELARGGLREMAERLERLMDGGPASMDLTLLECDQRLGDAVPRLVALVTPLAERCGVTLRWHVDDRIAHLATGLLESVMINAMRNAITAAATSSGPRRVEVAVGLDGAGRLELCVIDTGPGPGGTDATDGHGLGLVICRRIAERLGGTIELAAAPYGGGAILRMLVPAVRLEPARGAA